MINGINGTGEIVSNQNRQIEKELEIEKHTPTQIEGNMFHVIGERLSSYSV